VDSVTEQDIADRLSRQRADKITLVFSEAPAWHAVAANHRSVADLLAVTDQLSGEADR
jgi:putative ABC transport system ATP-binding protein